MPARREKLSLCDFSPRHSLSSVSGFASRRGLRVISQNLESWWNAWHRCGNNLPLFYSNYLFVEDISCRYIDRVFRYVEFIASHFNSIGRSGVKWKNVACTMRAFYFLFYEKRNRTNRKACCNVFTVCYGISRVGFVNIVIISCDGR